jgi:hypothetical protein
MAEYIELTEELMLAMNAGARAIENTKRYHGAVYTKDVFADNSQEIPYLLAAKVLREVSDAPAADVATVVHGWWEREPSSYWRWTSSGAVAVTRTTYRCGLCGRGTAVKSNYCPNCGAKMDGGDDDAAD